MERLMARFWWRNQGSGKGIHWCTWSRLTCPKVCGGLGFRDMSAFNIALLAKQCWRLITQPNCFLARVLKARYYPSCEFLQANLGSNPSFVWRSIYSARAVIEQGYGWRIGDGAKINIWGDPWLPGQGNGRVQNCSIDINYTRVTDLIDANKSWKSDVIQHVFDTASGAKILSIPLSKSGLQDQIIWRLDGSGTYSVKSGYRLLKGDLNTHVGRDPDTHSSSLRSFYTTLWEINLPSKIKIHMWKEINNFLPTYRNLVTRRLNVIDCCPFCHDSSETTMHIMRDCYYIQQLLAHQGIQVQVGNEALEWSHWVADFFSTLSTTARIALLVTYWAVWFSRNKIVHEGGLAVLQESLSFIQAFVLEHGGILHTSKITESPVNKVWTPPDAATIKCNFDSSYDSQTREVVSSIICRDLNGLIMASCIVPHWNVADVFAAEAYACLQAVTFASELGFNRVIVEGDSRSVICKVREVKPDQLLISPIIHDIKELAKVFGGIWFRFVHREANNAAHTLAKEGTGCILPQYWIEEAPHGTTLAAARDWEKVNSQ